MYYRSSWIHPILTMGVWWLFINNPGFWMVKLKKKTYCTKIIVHSGTLLKSVSAVGFSEKPSFWESVSSHWEMFGVTIFELVLPICIIKAMIFIKNKLVNLFTIIFSIKKIIFPSSLIKNNSSDKQSKHVFGPLKKHSNAHSWSSYHIL